MASGGNFWTRRTAVREPNWWEVLNNEGPKANEPTTDPSRFPRRGVGKPVPLCACLQCGEMIPSPKTCGSCKLGAYCSRECQRLHWPRHKPHCSRLQEAERERIARGLPRPPAPTPDPPLQLPTCDLVFSRQDYGALLRAHRAGRQAAEAARRDCVAGDGGASRGMQPGGGQVEMDPGLHRTLELQEQWHTHTSGNRAWSGGRQLDSCMGGVGQGRIEEGKERSPGVDHAAAAACESVSPSSSSSFLEAATSSSPSPSSPSYAAAWTPSSLSDALSDQQQPDQARVGPAVASGEQLAAAPAEAATSSNHGGRPQLWPASWPAPPPPVLLTPPRPAGILNTGNTCYAASAVQALLATPALGEYLRSGAHCCGCPLQRGLRVGLRPGAANKGGLPAGVSGWCPTCELSRLAAAAASSVGVGAAIAPKGEAAAAQTDFGSAEGDGEAGARCGSAADPRAPGGAAAVAGQAWPWSRCRPAVGAVDARGLTRHVFRLGRTLVPGRQEDAHELLAQLLEALVGVQLAEAGGRRGLSERAEAAGRAAQAGARQRQPTSSLSDGASGSPLSPPGPAPTWRLGESSLVHQVLGGHLRRATCCDCCGHVSQSHESLLGLEMDLGPRVGSVAAALRGYFADEVLGEGNEYRCGRCRQLVRATRRVRLEVAPNALALTLKRFAAGSGSGFSCSGAGAWGPRAAKDARPVRLHLDLDLTPYMAPGALDSGPATYRLYGVVQHLGVVPPSGSVGSSARSFGIEGPRPAASYATSVSLHEGHYVAVVRGGDGRWYRCDDDEVTRVGEAEVDSITDAYLLFYERIHPFVPSHSEQPDAPTGALYGGSGAGASVGAAAGGVADQLQSLQPPHAAADLHGVQQRPGEQLEEEWVADGAAQVEALPGAGASAAGAAVTRTEAPGPRLSTAAGPGAERPKTTSQPVGGRHQKFLERELQSPLPPHTHTQIQTPPGPPLEQPQAALDVQQLPMTLDDGEVGQRAAAAVVVEAAAEAASSSPDPPPLPLPSSPRWSAWLQPDEGTPRPGAVAAAAASLPALRHRVAEAAALGAPPAVVCPNYRLRPLRPARGGVPWAQVQQRWEWELRVHLPNVKAAREVRVAATCAGHLPSPWPATSCAVAPSSQAAHGTTDLDGRSCLPFASPGRGMWHSAGRVRVFVVGRYSLDLQLALRRGGGAQVGAEPTSNGGEGVGGDGGGAWEGECWQLGVVGGGARRTAARGGRPESLGRDPADAYGAVGDVDVSSLSVCAEPGAGAGEEVELEVLAPRWGPASSTLHVLLRLRPQLLPEGC